jgi:hypothetical protein
VGATISAIRNAERAKTVRDRNLQRLSHCVVPRLWPFRLPIGSCWFLNRSSPPIGIPNNSPPLLPPVIRKFAREHIFGRSCHVTRHAIFMVKSAQNRRCDHSNMVGQAMTGGRGLIEEQLVCDPFLTPSRFGPRHGHDQSLKIHRNWGTSWPRVAPPEEAPALTMPPDERVWLDHCQERVPVQQP